MLRVIFLFIIINLSSSKIDEIFIPLDTVDKKSIYDISLTEIGEFGIIRKSRPNIPAHLHTGIDVKRPNKNYNNQPILSIADGIVISKREDGPYAQLIIEHNLDGHYFWTVYEHIAGINVGLHQHVTASDAIARFFNTKELNTYGWQFDHFHFEILKINPIQIRPDKSNPERLFKSYTLDCQTEEQLHQIFYNPLSFFIERL